MHFYPFFLFKKKNWLKNKNIPELFLIGLFWVWQKTSSPGHHQVAPVGKILWFLRVFFCQAKYQLLRRILPDSSISREKQRNPPID
ncbi:MAG: hypothetical protein H0A76_12790 [Candidatus Thiodubiliella endoseptemdiera]|uniref:Uncharacterized protein n=1 Tax=Candidatus Thiodubiliella endoseptemdiera TaxID=2738886 RepID=A0A853F5J5_9GAMM|nr:hypothetical protein [Candidatus Thiodubiliella endoseptemdiera]